MGGKKLEWGVVVSLFVSASSVFFSAGVVYADVRDHERRIVAVEYKVEEFGKRLERIDANVEFLAQRAREDRAELLRR